MTPEQRADAKAREITKQIAAECIGIVDGKANLYDLDAADYIAAALLSVRNEALEDAARVADELKVGLPSRDVLPVQIAHNLSCDAIATAIRDLKEPTP